MSELFELPYDPSWGYGRRFFLDVEHRYTKMHRLLRERHGDLAGARILDLGLSRGLLLERFRRYESVRLGGIEIDPAEIERARERGLEPDPELVLTRDPRRMGLVAATRYVLRVRTNVVLIVASACGYYFLAGVQTFGIEFTTHQYGINQAVATRSSRRERRRPTSSRPTTCRARPTHSGTRASAGSSRTRSSC